MICIGPGPGPKNVLAEDAGGHRIVVPYAIWKHKLSKEEYMSDTPKVYVTAYGVVQKFGEKPAIQAREANGQTVHGFTISGILADAKSGGVKGAYIGISLWPELAALAPHVVEGMFVSVDGSYTQSSGQNGAIFHNINASRISVLAPVARAEREVVNQAPASAVPAAVPAAADPTAAQAPAPVAAPSGSPF